MVFRFAAVLAALAIAAPLAAQSASSDLTAATPLGGRWSWTPTTGGSEAAFVDSAGRAQLWLHCVRASRIVTIGRPAGAAAPFLNIWTSSATRNVPASFNPATGRSTASLSAYDSLLDALALSRGRIGVAVGTLPPLVAPAWPEITGLVEDCRS